MALLLLPPRAASGDDAGRWEEPIAARAGEIALLFTRVDPIRGFHELSFGVRSLRGKHKGGDAEPRPLLPEAHVAWLARLGEHALYARDMERARRALHERLVAEGWRELRTLPLGRDRSVGLAGVPLGWSVSRDGQGRVLELFRRDAPLRRAVLCSQAVERIDLPFERTEELDMARLAALAVTADLRWMVATVDSTVPTHGDLVHWRRVVLVPVRRILEPLGIEPADLMREEPCS